MGWMFLGIFMLVSMIGCCMGFKRFVWFLALGYGISIALLGASYLVSLGIMHSIDWIVIVQCLLLMVYGVRLASFQWKRDHNKDFAKAKERSDSGDSMNIFMKILIWVVCAALYIMQTCPVFYRGYNGRTGNIVMPVIGTVVMALGLIIESAADKQKQAQKKENPGKVAMGGLFKISRCPNYFGEILFWTGVILSGFGSLKGAGQWIVAVLGWVCIVYIMVDGAKRLDIRQEKTYGEDPEYRAYADHTPIIIPLIPVYHLGKEKK